MSEPEPPEMDVDTSMKSNSPVNALSVLFFTKPMTKPEPEMGVATSMNVANELQDNAVDILYCHLPKIEFNEVMKKLPRCRICGGFGTANNCPYDDPSDDEYNQEIKKDNVVIQRSL